MKKAIKRILGTLVFSIVITFMFSACYFVSSLENVCKMEYTEWIDSDSGIGFRRIAASRRSDSFGYITVNGKREEVVFRLLGGPSRDGLQILKINREDIFGVDPIIELCHLPIKYKEGKLSVTQSEINVFGQSYAKLVFEKRDIDRSTIDASEYEDTHFVWESDNSVLKFNNYNHKLKIGKGTATVNDVRKPITFVWRAQKKFEIFLGNVPSNADSPIASGTYTNNENVAILTFEEDSLYGGAYPTLTLTGEDKPRSESE